MFDRYWYHCQLLIFLPLMVNLQRSSFPVLHWALDTVTCGAFGSQTVAKLDLMAVGCLTMC